MLHVLGFLLEKAKIYLNSDLSFSVLSVGDFISVLNISSQKRQRFQHCFEHFQTNEKYNLSRTNLEIQIFFKSMKICQIKEENQSLKHNTRLNAFIVTHLNFMSRIFQRIPS